MTTARAPLQAWLTLGRVSNLPTVWTNVLAVTLLASSIGALPPPSPVIWTLLLVASSLLYLAGMSLNDLLDADWDRHHGNARPIAQGLLSRQQVARATGLQLAFAVAALLGLSTLIEQPRWLLGNATLLIVFIFGYNLLHKRWTHSVWLMGGCRSALYLTAAASLAEPPAGIWLCAALLGCYISGLTYLARQEHRNRLLSRAPALLMLSPLALALYPGAAGPGPGKIVFWSVLLLWLGWLGWHYRRHLADPERRQVRAFIGAGLAALPLFDALVLAVADQPLAGAACVAVFFLLPRFQQWIRPT